MQLFELVSPRLFRPLAGPNRAFYAELLLLLWEECLRTGNAVIRRVAALLPEQKQQFRIKSPLRWMPTVRAMRTSSPPATLTRWPWAFCCGCAAPAGWKSSPAATREKRPLPLCRR